MTQTDFCLDDYTMAGVLNEKHRVYLVRRKAGGELYVLKYLDVYHREIFERLMAKPIEGTPRIMAVSERNGILCVLEQYIPGMTLEAVLENGRVYSDYEALVFCEQLCRIVSDLHRAKPAIIHRDIKPANIMITPGGEIYLIDFNAAREDRGRESYDTELIGTHGYAAPEQYGFRSSSPVTDIYALGAVFNTMLTGALPRDRLPENDACRRIVEKASHMDPEKRFKSAEAMRRELQDSAVAAGIGGPGSRWGFRRYMMQHGLPGFRSLTWWKMLLAGLAYFVMLLGLVLLFIPTSGSPNFGEIFFCLSLYWSFLSLVFLYTDYHGFRDKVPFVKGCQKTVWKLVVGTIFLLTVNYILLEFAGAFYHPAAQP